MSNKQKVPIAIVLAVVLSSSGTFSARMRGDASQEGTQQQQPQQTQPQGGVKISGGVKLSGGVKMSGLAKSPQGSYWLDKWRQATISFGRVIPDRNGRQFYKVIGTGFIAATDSHKVYIVTAKHVFFDPEQNWHPDTLNVRFAWEEGQSVYSDFGLPLPLVRATTDLWTSPQDGSDIAAIPMPETFAQAANPETHQFQAPWPTDMASADDIYEGNSVIVLYPGIVGNEYLVRAVSRSGIIAWVSPNPDAHGIFMFDANLNEGNSGGPVIAVPARADRDGGISSGKRPILLGLVSKGPKQNITITAGGQPVMMSGPNFPQPSPLQGTVVGVGSFGVIEPGTKIKEFLLSLSATK